MKKEEAVAEIEEEVEAVKDLKEAEVRIEKKIIHLGDIDHHIIKNIEVIEIEEEVAHLHLVPLHHQVVPRPQMIQIVRRMRRIESQKFQSMYNISNLTNSNIGMFIHISKEERDRNLRNPILNCFGMVSNG